MDEPVAYMDETGLVNPFKTAKHTIPLYKHPRTWQGLDDEDWIKIMDRKSDKAGCEWDAETYDLIESMLKEKNT